MKRRNVIGYTLLFLTGCTTFNLFKTKNFKSNIHKKNDPTKDEQAAINMVLIPWQVSAEQEEILQPLAEYLTQKIQRPFKFQIAPDYKTAVDSLVEGKVELAYLSTSTYIEARLRDPHVEPLAAPINRETGRPWYTAVIVANTNYGIHSLTDLKGKRFAFVSKLSTSGYIVPMAHFQDIGIDPKRDFTKILFVGSHDKAKALLSEGKVDAIADDSRSYMDLQKKGKFNSEIYKVIWESTPIPSTPIVASRKVSQELKTILRKALIDAPEGLIDPSGTVGVGYTQVQDSDYDVIRQIQSRFHPNSR